MCPTMQFQVEEGGGTRNQQRSHKKTRRSRKRRHCCLFGSERMWERCSSVKERRAGKPVTSAPENTTQFIMADKEAFFPSPCESTSSETSSKSVRGTPLSERDFKDTEDDLVREFDGLDFDLEYFQRDFNETYLKIQKETLLSLSKCELVERYQQLSNREDELHKQIRKITPTNNSAPFGSAASCSTREDVGSFLAELERLRSKNQSLEEENCKLKARNLDVRGS